MYIYPGLAKIYSNLKVCKFVGPPQLARPKQDLPEGQFHNRPHLHVRRKVPTGSVRVRSKTSFPYCVW